MNFIKSICLGIIIFFIMNLLITICSYFNLFSDQLLNIIKILTFIITYLLSGIYLGLLTKKKILLNGSILSLIYIFFSLLLIIIIPSLEFSIKLFINYLLILLICNIGTFIGVNKRRSK